MGYRYIGSKSRIARDIINYLGKPTEKDGYFVDAFSGTGVVASSAADNGWSIVINDMMYNAVTMSEAQLLSEQDVPFSRLGGYKNAILELNNAPLVRGFFWNEYSPASSIKTGIERKYFTENNAIKIDTIIATIKKWTNEKKISLQERTLLNATLIYAVNNVANIAGTYGCFLSKWSPQSLRELELKPLCLRKEAINYLTYHENVFNLTCRSNDVVYLDPPYTKRQYASYYHILETIVIGDTPEVQGVSGLRPWHNKASVFCYKNKALSALSRLVVSQHAKRVLISYSNDGHIKLNDLIEDLKKFGDCSLVDLGSIGRYRPNQTASSRQSNVNEFLIDFRKWRTI